MPKPDRLLLLTEGTRTEPLYFQGLSSSRSLKPFQLMSSSSPDPKKLLGKALSLHAKGLFESVWIVADVESGADRVRDRHLRRAVESARKAPVHLVLSNPAFEYWLLLHAEAETRCETPLTVTQCVQRLSRCWNGYSKSSLPTNPLFAEGRLEKALGRSKITAHSYPSPTEVLRKCPSTGMGLLVEHLLAVGDNPATAFENPS